MTIAALERRSAELVLEAAFAEDGLDGPAMLRSPLVQRALENRSGTVRISLGLDRPVIGLGASAPLVYPAVGRLLSTEAVIPHDAGVANAVGAVVGEVRVKVTAHISQPEEGRFRVSVGAEVRDFTGEEAALAFAETTANDVALAKAAEAGAADAHVDIGRDIKTATIEGQRKFIEGTISASAHGRPRLGN